MRVALDAGHGAGRGCPHTGAAAHGLIEDVLALDFVRRIGHHLRARGHSTVYTRPDWRLVSLSLRVRVARRSSCGFLLSIHCNAGPVAANGVEAFVAVGDTRSMPPARRMVEAVEKLGMRSRGAKPDFRSGPGRLAVLRGARASMPAVLLEVGFLTNPADSARLADPAWRESASAAIAAALSRQEQASLERYFSADITAEPDDGILDAK